MQPLFDLAVICVGFTSVCTQTLFIRELVSVFAGNELSLGLIFSAWLFWTAVGSWLLGRFADKIRNKINIFVLSQVLISIVLPLIVNGIRALKPILRILPGQIVPLNAMVYSTFLLLAPFCIISGFQFALGCSIYAGLSGQRAEGISRVYIRDALGDMLGGFAFGYFFISYFHSFQTITFVALLNLLLGIMLLSLYKEAFRKVLFSIVVLLVGGYLVIVSSLRLNRINEVTLWAGWKRLAPSAARTSKYANYIVTRQGDLNTVYGNGSYLFTNPDPLHSEELVHFPLLQVENPRQVLILGGAVGGALQEILKYPVKEVAYVELDRTLIELASQYVTPQDRAALTDSRVKIIYTDGRLFVKNYRGEKFDCVIVNTGNPLTAEINRYYTLEFFKEITKLLNKKGVISLAIPSSEIYLSPALGHFNGCIYHTLKEVFPWVVIVPGDPLFLIASRSGDYLADQADILSSRLRASGITTSYVNEHSFPFRFYPERIKFISAQLEKFSQLKLNRDFYPISYFYDLILWGAEFQSNFTQLVWRFSRINFLWILVLLLTGCVILLWSKKKSQKYFISLVVMNVGAAGIGLELILIIGFLILFGYLYHYIGIISASFMLGLILGARWITSRFEKFHSPLRWLSKWQLYFSLYAFLIPLLLLSLSLVSRRVSVGLAVRLLLPLLTVIDGCFVGVVFPLANKIRLENKKAKVASTAGSLYASDLIGSCIGSLLVSVLFIPVLGLFRTSVIIGFLGVINFLLLFSMKTSRQQRDYRNPQITPTSRGHCERP